MKRIASVLVIGIMSLLVPSAGFTQSKAHHKTHYGRYRTHHHHRSRHHLSHHKHRNAPHRIHRSKQILQPNNHPVAVSSHFQQPKSSFSDLDAAVPAPTSKVESQTFSEPQEISTSPMLPSEVKGNWLVNVGFGMQYPYYKSETTINNGSGAPAPFDKDIYTYNRNFQTHIAGAVGYRWLRNEAWLPAYSFMVQYNHIFSGNIGGNVTLYSDPAFTNYRYSWDFASDMLLALFKINIYEYQHFSPYLVGGLGGAYDRMSNFSESPMPGITPRTSPGFEANSVLQFAYRIGLGVDYEVKANLFVSAEYQYQDMGTVESNHGTGTWSGELLNLGPYRSNGVQLNVTYLIDDLR